MAIKKKRSIDTGKRASGKSAKVNGSAKSSKAAKKKPVDSIKAREVTIDTIVRGAMLGLQTAAVPSERKPFEFRVSGLPFCPLLAGLSPLDGKDVYREHYYFGIGTAMHELFQKWLARSVSGASMWGDWECGCKRTKRNKDGKLLPVHEIVHKVRPDGKCPGGKEWFYREVEVEFGNLKGHIDLIWRVPGGYKNGKRLKPWYLVWDWKSTEIDKENPKTGKKKKTKKIGWGAYSSDEPLQSPDDRYPIPSNVVQISTYCAILTSKLKLNVKGWALVYADRSRPILRHQDMHIVPHAWTPSDQERWEGLTAQACKGAPHALKAVDLRLKGKAIPAALLKSMVDTRPCRRASDHANYMKADFHYENEKECPHKGICCSGKGSDAQVTKLFRDLYRKDADAVSRG